MPSNDSNSNQVYNTKEYNKNDKWRTFYKDSVYISPMSLYDFIAMKNDLLRRNGKSTVSRSKNVNVVLWVIARHLPTVTPEGKETNLKDISAATWMSLDYIADQAGISKSRVSESIRYLKDEGIIIETIDDRKGHNERYRAFSEYAINVIVENTDSQFARYGKRNWRLRKAELTVTESVTNRVMDRVKELNNKGGTEVTSNDILNDLEKFSSEGVLSQIQAEANHQNRIKRELEAMAIDCSNVQWNKLTDEIMENVLKACLIFEERNIKGNPLDLIPPDLRRKPVPSSTNDHPPQLSLASLGGISGMTKDILNKAQLGQTWIPFKESEKMDYIKDTIEKLIRNHSFKEVSRYYEEMIALNKKGQLVTKMTMLEMTEEGKFKEWQKYANTK